MTLIEIKDEAAPELDVYSRLTGAELRSKKDPSQGIFIAESPMVIEVALKMGYIPLSLLTDKRLLAIGGVERVVERLGGFDMPIYTAERELLTSIIGFELTRGALAAFRRPLPRPLSEVVSGASRIAVLENVTDATNIGAIFRSAAALGIDAVLTTPSCCDPLSRRAVRVSMGTVLQVPHAQIGGNPDEWRERGTDILRDLGFKSAALALTDRSVSISDTALAGEERLALILGTEGDGLYKSTISSADYTVKIPMFHGVDSLNVGSAAAVAFWELSARRKEAEADLRGE